jgi:hypothetical protein
MRRHHSHQLNRQDAGPMNDFQIQNMRKYKLKLIDIPEEVRKRQATNLSKKRDRKAIEKNNELAKKEEIKEDVDKKVVQEPVTEQTQSLTGLPYLDEAISNYNSIAPRDLKT